MTPLAQKIVGNLALPLRRRDEGFDAEFAKGIMAAQCFEVSVIWNLLDEMLKKESALPVPDVLLTSFLPSDPVWIEYKDTLAPGRPCRCGHLLRGREVYTIQAAIGGKFSTSYGRLIKAIPTDPQRNLRKIFNAIALINSPKSFGRKQHQPHVGLQRKLANALGMVGKFPLQAWTEITLDMAPPIDRSGEGQHVAMLSGRKSLHYVRAHLRELPQGLAVVTGHWRGDPSIGIKRSRYCVSNKQNINPEQVLELSQYSQSGT